MNDQGETYIPMFFFFFFFGLRPFSFLCTVFTLGVLYPEHLQLAFDCVVIACSLESIRPGLVQGCKTPNGVGSACLRTSSESLLPHCIWSVHLKSAPAGTRTCDLTIGPSQATPSLPIGVLLSPHTDMWGAVTNGMPTSLGIMQTLIHCLGQGSVADKLGTSQYPSMSVADISV